MVEHKRSISQDIHDDWHPADIVAHLRKRGLSLRSISIKNGYHPGALGQALHRPWPKGEGIIAEAMGLTPWDVWPQRYLHRSRRDAAREALRADRIKRVA